MKYLKIISLISATLLVGCQSAKKYNEFNQNKISVQKLHKDIDYTQKKFIKMHPDTDLYIPMDSLKSNFAKAKKNINQPLTPSEFYEYIAPVIASVKQGHSRVVFPSKKSTKESIKKYKDTRGPLNQLSYKWINDTLYVAAINIDSSKIVVGSKVLEINGVKPSELYANYIKNNTSDGFNKTYLSKGFDKRFTHVFTDKFGTLDSIKLVLQCQDSVYNITNKRFSIKKTNKQIAQKNLDSTNVAKRDSLKSLSKEQKLLAKNEQKNKELKTKQLRKKGKMLGLINGEFNRKLIFPISKDSTYAILKIKSFNVGNFKKSYDSLFTTIKEKNIKHLVLDLRDNPGGRLADIDELYAYLKTQNDPLIAESSVVSKFHLPAYFIAGKSTATYIALAPIYPIMYPWIYLNTYKNKNGDFNYKVAGLKNKKIKDIAYKNKLDVLVNGGSFSASCIITSNLQGSGRALVYGEETGGTYNGTVAGIMPLIKLPNSKLRVRVGLMHIKPFYQTETYARGIFPNKEIILTTDEILYNADTEYELIYNTNN